MPVSISPKDIEHIISGVMLDEVFNSRYRFEPSNRWKNESVTYGEKVSTLEDMVNIYTLTDAEKVTIDALINFRDGNPIPLYDNILSNGRYSIRLEHLKVGISTFFKKYANTNVAIPSIRELNSKECFSIISTAITACMTNTEL